MLPNNQSAASSLFARWAINLIKLSAAAICLAACAAPVTEENPRLISKSWVSFRDASVVRQNFETTCGAASLATVLNNLYGFSFSESDILSRLGSTGRMSLSRLAQVSEDLGFNAIGVSVPFETLTDLQVPVIAYVHYQGDDHFTVVTGISEQGDVALADSSWGNRTLTQGQFESMWALEDHGDKPVGSFLAILPSDTSDMSPNFESFNAAQKLNALRRSAGLVHSNLYR